MLKHRSISGMWVDSTGQSVSFGVERITPELAREYLKANVRNRKPKTHKITQYAHAIGVDRWEWNGSSITFDRDGALLDGQNRLFAIVKANLPIDQMVVRGLAPKTQRSVDTGAGRTAAGDLQIMKVANANAVAATAKLLMAANRGAASNSSFLKQELLELLERWPEIEESVKRCNAGNLRKINVPIVSAWYFCARFLLGHGNAPDALAVLETGIPAFKGDPMHAFRERFIGDARDITRNEICRLRGLWTLFRCYDDWRDGIVRKQVKVIQTEYRLRGLDYDRLNVL